jgi:hypothetical protein
MLQHQILRCRYMNYHILQATHNLLPWQLSGYHEKKVFLTMFDMTVDKAENRDFQVKSTLSIRPIWCPVVIARQQ